MVLSVIFIFVLDECFFWEILFFLFILFKLFVYKEEVKNDFFMFMFL